MKDQSVKIITQPSNELSEDEWIDISIFMKQFTSRVKRSVEKSAENTEEGLDLEVKEKQEEASFENKEVNKLTQEFGEYDPTLELGSFKMPDLEHLANHGDGKYMVSDEELEVNKDRIIETLLNFNIKVDKKNY